MEIFEQKSALTNRVKHEKKSGKSIGFVPTMGALHAGHLALVARAREENDLVICSIFVNPKQFNNPEDLKQYPRTLETDLDQLQSIGCDFVFCPEEDEMYPDAEIKTYDFGLLDKVMEGRYRQGHFNGVAVVVKKLFDIVQPHRAYFGEKDYQQLLIIKALVKMEDLDVEIIPCSTIRESDGLAMSSRNTRLTEAQRREAPKIFQVLSMARKMFPKHPLSSIEKRVIQEINASPELKVEYFEIVSADNLLPAGNNEQDVALVGCIAVFAGQIRLIDNLLINS